MNTTLQIRPALKDFAPPAAYAISPRSLKEILDTHALQAWFQQVMDLKSGEIVGYEGLIRGPSNSPHHSPAALFAEAERLTMLDETEALARLCVIRRFAELALPGKLFLNVSPTSLAHPSLYHQQLTQTLHSVGLAPQRVVIELTENKPFFDLDGITQALQQFREAGFAIAIDDLGAGFSSLRLWSDLLPEIVKLDMHFVQGVHRDTVKYNFLRSVQDIAARCNTHIVAEGIETEEDLIAVRKLGIRYGQGYLIGRPAAMPATTVSTRMRALLGSARMQLSNDESPLTRRPVTVEKLLIPARTFDLDATNQQVFTYFEQNPQQMALPVVCGDEPVGLINRHQFFERYARQSNVEVCGRNSCMQFADAEPLVVDKNITIHNLSRTLIQSESRHLAEGFIITGDSRYLGYGTGQDLVREITHMQIEAARYANPLTLLPGNVPIDEHIERLLHVGKRFVACHCDLDSFKPFNDIYGYQRGDEMILLTARVLADICDTTTDFIGHLGGDDFILLMQSADWEARIERALKAFDSGATLLFDAHDRQAGSFKSADRLGKTTEFALTSLSVGAVVVEPGTLDRHKEVAARAAEAKKQAKRMPGSAYFVERRGVPAKAATMPIKKI